MTQKVAAAIIHGMGNQKENFAEKVIQLIQEEAKKQLKLFTNDPDSQIVIESVCWADVFEEQEEELFQKLVVNEQLRWMQLRRFVIHFLADTIAYQPVKVGKQNYERVHDKVKESLYQLSKKAGETAPLCIISHSLGSVIASDYFYDLQAKLSVSDLSPLEAGDTLNLFYTLGTTLPLWSLRYHDFDSPIHIPSKKLNDYYPELKGEWINFYDKDDILGYPLKNVNAEYYKAVTEDRAVNIGNVLESWNPLSHRAYLTDKDVIRPIAQGLIHTWRTINDK
ncbi:chemotaxis protein [Bacillus taeanensis]|uniref:Chemotaxis protein n=1 Tax=Bacillus taeanensis TaxID=273032 RepID=A0A366Y0A0_9BACI|nr:chemotaxis protein [Bacillus taeanensis]RBW69833.1 chemotaxis protein [Bacillus taeanensis]